MDISFDPAKRDRTLTERGLDFADAGLVFAGVTATIQDMPPDYGEDRDTSPSVVSEADVLSWRGRYAATLDASFQ
jgi:uncharacterized protein